MDYKHWLKFLSPELLIKWETEIIMQEKVSRIGHPYDNFEDFINASMKWSRTEDGYQFWADICHTPVSELIDRTEEQKTYFYGL